MLSLPPTFSAVESLELGQTKLGDANHPWLPHSSTGSYGGTTETYSSATGPFHRKGQELAAMNFHS